MIGRGRDDNPSGSVFPEFSVLSHLRSFCCAFIGAGHCNGLKRFYSSVSTSVFDFNPLASHIPACSYPSLYLVPLTD